MMDGAGSKSRAKQPRERRLVRRSRLLAAIEESDRRTVLLVAPAGYGKTTLARQWLETAPGAWVTVTTASADIPVLARDLASALGEVAKLDSRRVETALSAGKTAADQTRNVARTILAQIKEPIDGWVVIDDYHLLMANPAAEELIEALERSGNFRLMVTARERPSWATPRRRVYLETVEFGASELALDDDEIAHLLPPDRRNVGLRSQARGWPAVIALAAHAGALDLPLSADAISETLYDYFAEELYERAAPNVQRCLATLAVLPPLSVADLEAFLGEVEIANQLVSTGLAHAMGGGVEVHPLARAVLVAKLGDREDGLEIKRAGLDLAQERGLHDHAFALIREFGMNDRLESLIAWSYASLIETGRIATLERFGRYAEAHGEVSQSLLDLVVAEVALIEGEFQRAQALATSGAVALPRDHPLKPRGYLIAGRAAHLANRFEAAFDLHLRATRHATSPRDVRDAVWGKYLAALFLEDERTEGSIQELEALAQQDPTDRMRLAIARMTIARVAGNTGLQTLEVDVSHLLAVVADPWVRSGWSFTLGYSLTLQARYDEAQKILRKAILELGEFGFSFGLPQVEWTLAASELGLRHFSRCEALIRRVERNPSYARDLHMQLNTRALLARLQLAQQRAPEALATTADEFDRYPSRAMHGEYLATRSLALAVTGDREAALATANRATHTTHTIESQILCAATQALVALDEPPSSGDPCASLLDLAARHAAWDGVVCAVRASPALLSRLLLTPRHRAELRDVLLRSNDVALARSVGLVTRSTGPSGVLSPREREIMDHLIQGRKNSEIAASLFIAPGTVKSHVDHIYDKLGVRSRAAAVARYAEIEKEATAGSGS